jgi:glutamate---cysteine ligase / carboxylate-amine ligase
MAKLTSPLDVFEWSAWRAGADELTIGIEEEFMLLDPRDWSLAFQADEVVIDLPPDLRDRVTLETHAAVMEIATGVHERIADAAIELADLRGRLASVLGEHGLRAAVAGTHPCAVAEDTVVSAHPRYRDIGETMRVLARREPTLATHVHVGVPTPAAAIRLLNRLRAHLPLLLALSGNSPFWKGTDTGFASSRTTLFDAFPRSGVPRTFAGYWDWIATVDLLVRSGAISEPSFLWWDVRLQPRFGTVEVRVMDGQTSVEDVAALAALIQCLASLELERAHAPADSVEVIEENRFLAARDGMHAQLIDFGSGERIPASDLLEHVLSACAPHAERLDCEHELAGARRLAGCSGAARQRALAAESSPREVAATLAAVYASEVVAVPC